MWKCITTLFLLAGLLVPPATAMGDYNPGGPKTRFYAGYLRVHNAVDDAVQVAAGEQVATLEPQETRQFDYLLGNKSATIDVTVSLVSDPSVTAKARVKLENAKTTDITVVYSGGTLSIELPRPAKASAGKK